MAKIPIFQDSIIFGSIINKELNKTILNVLENKMKENEGVFHTNRGGYQTEIIFNEEINNLILEKSAKLIIENYNLKNIKIGLKNLWINRNLKGNYNSPHIHQRSNFSGIYYVEVTEEGGDLIFFRGDRSSQILYIQDILQEEDFREEFHIKPVKNQLIIFPSHLIHMVTPHLEDKPRVSVSFNLSISKNG
jgi:uncharacterized protein (TIGR02466 family)